MCTSACLPDSSACELAPFTTTGLLTSKVLRIFEVEVLDLSVLEGLSLTESGKVSFDFHVMEVLSQDLSH